MDNQVSKESLSALEMELEGLFVKGVAELKQLYFNIGLMLEEQAGDIGIRAIYFKKGLVRINGKPCEENVEIRKQDLINVYPEVKTEAALELFKEYTVIYKSKFFERLKTHYEGFVGLIFSDNGARFENNDLTAEFMLYKATLRRKKLEQELSIDYTKVAKKIKI